MLTLSEIRNTKAFLSQWLPETPVYCWKALNDELKLNLWVKHENHLPQGAFKIRGGLTYVSQLSGVKGIISATKGNHGQSLGFAAGKFDIPCTIVVPEENCPEKNMAMKALGVNLVEAGKDFSEAAANAREIAKEEDLHFVPSFHVDLIKGVATYWYEFFESQPDLEVVYVPVGLGSGICAAIETKKAMNSNVEIIGVVSDRARAYKLSFESGVPISSEATTEVADGLAVREPNPNALEIMLAGVSRFVEVSDDEIFHAIKLLYTHTHNLVEGAGAAGLAAAKKEGLNKKIGVPLCGGNINKELLIQALNK